MANNRVWLKNKDSGETILLGKYYPTLGWYNRTIHELNDVLDDTSDAGTFGGRPFELEYEIEED